MSKEIPSTDGVAMTTTVETVEVVAPATLQAGEFTGVEETIGKPS